MLEPDRVRNTLMVRGLPRYVEKSGRLEFKQKYPGIDAPLKPESADVLVRVGSMCDSGFTRFWDRPVVRGS